MKRLLLGLALALASTPVLAHQLVVFAETDCATLTVEAVFSSGKVPVAGTVRVLNADEVEILSLPLGDSGKLTIPLEGIDTTGGLVVEVDTGDHSDYWIVTPEDFAHACAD